MMYTLVFYVEFLDFERNDFLFENAKTKYLLNVYFVFIQISTFGCYLSILIFGSILLVCTKVTSIRS